MSTSKSIAKTTHGKYRLYGCVVALLLIALSGNTAYGQKRPAKLPARPRMFFTSQDLPALRKMAKDTTVDEAGISGVVLWKKVLKAADAAVKNDSAIPPEFKEYAGRKTGHRWRPLALAYAVTKKKVYLDQLRKDLRTIMGWKTWGETVGFSIRGITIGVAMTLDVAWDELPEKERKAACKALVERGLIPIYKAGKDQKRALPDNNNGVYLYSAMGLGATVLLGEKDYPDAEKWFDEACKSMKTIIDKSDPDGSWGEGIGYGTTAFDGMGGLAMMDAMKRFRGVDLFAHKFMKNLPLFGLHTMLPAGGMGGVGFNDTWQGNGFQLVVMRAAMEYRVPQYTWYLKRTDYYNKDRNEAIPAVNAFIQYRPSLRPKSPDGVMPVSRFFSGLGWATCRTSWSDPDAVLFAFQSEHFGHAHEHNSMNHFEIHGYGSRLATSAGYHHGREWAATMGHNIIWVDGGGQKFASWGGPMGGGIKTFLGSRFFDYVVGQTNVYGSKREAPALKNWRRHVVFAKPDYLVFFDDIKSDGVAREYKWILNVTCAHAIGQKGKFKIEGDTVLSLPELNPTGQLAGKVLLPTEFTAKSAMFHGKWFPKEAYGPYYSITPKQKRVAEKFLVVLYPQPRGAAAPKIQGFKAKNGQGVEVAVPDGKNLHLYRLTGKSVEARGLETDGLTCMIGAAANGDRISYALCKGKELKQDGKVLISCSKPISAAFAKWSKYTRRADRLPIKTIEPDVLYGSVTLAKKADLRFFTARSPKSVTINGRKVSGATFDKSTGLLSMPLPSGRHSIEVRLGK